MSRIAASTTAAAPTAIAQLRDDILPETLLVSVLDMASSLLAALISARSGDYISQAERTSFHETRDARCQTRRIAQNSTRRRATAQDDILHEVTPHVVVVPEVEVWRR